MGIKIFITLCIWLFTVGNLCRANYVKNAVQFRISESEFNKVASSLMSQEQDMYETGVMNDKLNGIYSGMKYEFDELIHKSTRKEMYIDISRDGMLVVTQRFSNIQLLGSLKISLNRVHIFDGDFNVTLRNVTVLITSNLGVPYTEVPSDNQHVFDMYSFNCSADVESIVENQKTKTIDELTTDDVLTEIFTNAVCHSVMSRLTTGLEGSNITFLVFDQHVFISIVASGLEVKNKTFLITYAIKTTSEDSRLINNIDNILIPFPELREMREPFEVVIRTEMLNELFRDFLQKLGIGKNKVLIADLLPGLTGEAGLDTDEFQKKILFLFPGVNEVYPKSVASIVVHDADIYFKAKNGSLQMHFDITCEMSVTLRCDKNRTYSAFNFTMNLLFPVSVRCDNKYLTFELLGFGGNFTVLNTTIGHIVDRVTAFYLSIIPSYAEEGVKELNDNLRGIRLADFLPKDVFATFKTISVKEDSIIVGGNLSLTDPQLPIIKKSKLVWVGNNASEKQFSLSVRDHSPRDLAPEEKKTCDKPQSVIGSATIVTYHVLLICITSSIMYV